MVSLPLPLFCGVRATIHTRYSESAGKALLPECLCAPSFGDIKFFEDICARLISLHLIPALI